MGKNPGILLYESACRFHTIHNIYLFRVEFVGNNPEPKKKKKMKIGSRPAGQCRIGLFTVADE